MSLVNCRTVTVDGLDVFYREAGPADAPSLLLLHGFPTASHMFRDLIFRKQRPRLLAVWGENDPFFLPAGAKAFQRDIPDAEIHFFNTGHFALETHAEPIATAIRAFLSK
jgi:pimeloyl-ACP methyl ester carboxylesterase